MDEDLPALGPLPELEESAGEPAASEPRRARGRWGLALRWTVRVAAAAAVLLGLYAWQGVPAWGWQGTHDRYGPIFWLWAGGVLAWWASFWGTAAGEPREARRGGAWWVPWLLMGAALLLRLPAVGHYPYGFHRDEGFALEAAEVIAYGGVGNVFSQIPPRWVYSSSMQLLPRVPFILWFGHQVISVRLASVVLGVLSIGVVYLMARRIAGVRVGIYAAVLLVLAYTHVHYSRTGTPYTQPPFVAALVVWLLVRAIQRRSKADAVAAGLALGIGLGAYGPIKILLPLLLVWWGLASVLAPKHFFLRHGFRLLLTLATAAAVAAPVYTDAANRALLAQKPKGMSVMGDEMVKRMVSRYRLARNVELSPAMQEIALRAAIVRENCRRAWPAFWRTNAQIATGETVSVPLFHHASLYLMALGVLVVVARWRDPAFLWLPWMPLLSFLVGVCFTDRTGGMWRLSVAEPAMATLFALGLERLFPMLVWPFTALPGQLRRGRQALLEWLGVRVEKPERAPSAAARGWRRLCRAGQALAAWRPAAAVLAPAGAWTARHLGQVPVLFAVVLLAYLAVWNARVLTGHYRTVRAGDGYEVIGRAVTEARGDYRFVVQASPKLFPDIAILKFRYNSPAIQNMANLLDEFPGKVPDDKPLMFLFADETETWIAPWRDLFPFVPLEGLPNGAGRVCAWRAVADCDDQALARRIGQTDPTRGVRGVYYPRPNWEGGIVMERVDPLLEFNFGAPFRRKRDESMVWTGWLVPPAPGHYQFQLRTRFGEHIDLTVQLGEGKLLDRDGAGAGLEVSAARLPVPVHVRYSPRNLSGAGAGYYLSWQPPGAPAMVRVPREVLRPELPAAR